MLPRASPAPSRPIHSVIRPTTGSAVGPNSVERRLGDAGEVARALDAGHLHAEADAEIRHLALAREADAGDLALRAALAERAGDEDRVARLELRGDLASSSPSNSSASIQRMLTLTRLAMPPWTSASLSDLYASCRPTYLPTTPIVTSPSGLVSRSTMSAQRARSGARAGLDPEGAQHLRVEPLGVILQRHRVDALGVERRDDRGLRARCRTARSWRARDAGSGCSQRQTSTSGWTPSAASSRTECWVGLVFSSPAAAM